jgi:selenocysteine lyase/cysteine desulfurase
VWLDTPAAAPGAGPVVDAVSEAVELWRTGERHWPAWWEDTRGECRSLIAAYLGVADDCVALMGSFAEAAATVAAWMLCPRGAAWLAVRGDRTGQLRPRERVEQHCLTLAAAFRDGARAARAMPVGDGSSHIAAVRVADPQWLLARLRSAGIRAAALGDRLRAGFHYFNNDSDVEAILRVLREAR